MRISDWSSDVCSSDLSSRSRCRDRNDVGRRTAALDQIAEKFAPGIQCAGLLRQIFIEVVHGADARCLAALMVVDHALATIDRKAQRLQGGGAGAPHVMEPPWHELNRVPLFSRSVRIFGSRSEK